MLGDSERQTGVSIRKLLGMLAFIQSMATTFAAQAKMNGLGRAFDVLEHQAERKAAATVPGDGMVARQVQTVITVVVIGVTAIIGILIYSQINSSLADPANSDLNNSSEAVTEGFGSAMQLVPTVLIVLVAAVVIGVVQRLRG